MLFLQVCLDILQVSVPITALQKCPNLSLSTVQSSILPHSLRPIIMSTSFAFIRSLMPVHSFNYPAWLSHLSVLLGLGIFLWFHRVVVIPYLLAGLWRCSSHVCMHSCIVHLVQLLLSVYCSVNLWSLPILLFSTDLFPYAIIVNLSSFCSFYLNLTILFLPIIICFLIVVESFHLQKMIKVFNSYFGSLIRTSLCFG